MSIILYTQPDCRPCKRVAQKLKEAGVEFELVDLTVNLIAADYVKKVIRASSTPIIEVDGREPIIGYQPDKVKELILEFSDSIHDYVYEGDDQ